MNNSQSCDVNLMSSTSICLWPGFVLLQLPHLHDKTSLVRLFLVRIYYNGVCSKVFAAAVFLLFLSFSLHRGRFHENVIFVLYICLKQLSNSRHTNKGIIIFFSFLVCIQEAFKRSNNWLPPPWAIMAMVILGFNEFMMLLK